jgi:hypothetical protein
MLHQGRKTKHTMRIVDEMFTEFWFFHNRDGTISSGMDSGLAAEAALSSEEEVSIRRG